MTNPPPGPSYPGGHDPSHGRDRLRRPRPTASASGAATCRPDRTHSTPGAGRSHGAHRAAGTASGAAHPADPPPAPGAPVYPTQTAQPQSYPATAPKESKLRRFVKDPLSIVLILVIVAALGLAALLGGELYARHRANSVVAKVVECVVKDKADASFGVVPPFLWQHLNRHYTNLSDRDGRQPGPRRQGHEAQHRHQGRPAAELRRLRRHHRRRWWRPSTGRPTASSRPCRMPSRCSAASSRASRPMPSGGTVELDGPLGTVIAKPRVTDGSLGLEVQSVTGAGLHPAQRIGAAGAGRFHLAPDQRTTRWVSRPTACRSPIPG